jgi:hypothetical protein
VRVLADILCRMEAYQGKRAHACAPSTCPPFRARNFCLVKAKPRLSLNTATLHFGQQKLKSESNPTCWNTQYRG